VGRPPKADIHDPKVVERICNLVASGVSIGEVCRRKDFPAESTVYLHMANDETFRSLIARAREAQQEREADKTVELADKATPENWQVVKLRIWARQWRAAKLAPKKYGEKQTLEHSGPDGGAIETRDVSPRDEIERRLKGIAERVATNVAPPAKKK
jgi:hypothetical protein